VFTRALIATVAALAATATPALASGFTLELTSPPAVVGQPIVLTATGTIPIEDLPYAYWFSLDAIPTSVTSTCPAESLEGMQFAEGTGGAIIVVSQREAADSTGRFRIPVAITPTAPGTVLLCAYTDDGETTTLARASLLLNIARAASRPSRLTQDVRGCHALFAGAGERRCVRRAVKRAKARCRRYESRRREVRCLRKVRRIARQAT
jgi:hypothetical protein